MSVEAGMPPRSDPEGDRQRLAREEARLRTMMIPKKHRGLYRSMMRNRKRRVHESKQLERKRRRIEEAAKEEEKKK